MKRAAAYLFVCGLVLLTSVPVMAASYTIVDNYRGGNSNNTGNYASNEVIGDDQYWSVSKMEVNVNPATITVDVYSRFFNNIGYHNVYMGDLFLSVDGWNPYGPAPYSTDIHTNGENWEYVLNLDYDRYSDYTDASGSFTVYQVDPSGTIMLPENQPAANRSTWYRAGQEIYYIPYSGQESYKGQSGLGTGTGLWSINNLGGSDTDDYLRFIFANDFGVDEGDFAFRWQMTCANDVIEGRIDAVPIPPSALLLLPGLAFLVGNRARDRKMSYKSTE